MEKKLYDGHSYEFAHCWAVLSYNKSILMSWGIDPYSIKEVENGTSFHVNGFKHTGYVEVIIDYATDTFSVVLKSDAGEIISSHTDVYLGELVRLIDDLVEKTEDYEERIRREYLAV